MYDGVSLRCTGPGYSHETYGVRRIACTVVRVRHTVGSGRWPTEKWELKGEVHQKMKMSHLVVFGEPSRMVKVRGACDKPFWTL